MSPMILKIIIYEHREKSNPNVCEICLRPTGGGAPLPRGQVTQEYAIVKEYIELEIRFKNLSKHTIRGGFVFVKSRLIFIFILITCLLVPISNIKAIKNCNYSPEC